MENKIKKRAEEIGKEYAYPFFEQYTNGVSNFGLTKFELFAKDAMQGLLAQGAGNIEGCVEDSLKFAKALCLALAAAELEGGQQNG